MNTVLLATQFLDSREILNAKEQKSVNAFVRTFRANPAHPGLSFERIHSSNNVWSARISRGLRAIVHKDGEIWSILFVGKHDVAYDWANRRSIGRHSVTGTLTIVEFVEKIVERIVPHFVQPETPSLFHGKDAKYLVSLGLPESWLPAIDQVKNDDHLLILCEKLPEDVAERLMMVAMGEFVTPPIPVSIDRPVIEAPDTRRRFHLVVDDESLEAALNAPMDRWIAFLHPSQKMMVEKTYSGPSKISGSAGTGKTVVAMHRARFLSRRGERVLLTSYGKSLCENLGSYMEQLCSYTELQGIEIKTVHKVATEIVSSVERVSIIKSELLYLMIEKYRLKLAGKNYSEKFVRAEWDNVLRVNGINTWASYRSVRRVGRGRGLAMKERKILWRVFSAVFDALQKQKQLDWTGLCQRAETLLREGKVERPYTSVIIDEVQDLKSSDLRFLFQLCSKPENFMVCGDTGQRIYAGRFSLKSLGIEVRGRSKVLRVNYRTTEQIRRKADHVLGKVCDDMDGGEESRTKTRSLMRGPEPRFLVFNSSKEEMEHGVAEIQSWLKSGLRHEAIGVFVRTNKQVEEFVRLLEGSGIPVLRLKKDEMGQKGFIKIGTMHRAKGLEFKVVRLLGCGDDKLPDPITFEHYIHDPQDFDDAMARERSLLYVAMTRARDELTLSWVGETSRFLKNIKTEDTGGKE